MRAAITIGLWGAFLSGVLQAEGENWPRFRGPGGMGVAATQLVPVELTEETLAWAVPLPGPGSSCPVVWGDRVFVTSENRQQGEVSLLCLDAKSGKRQWSQAVKTGDYQTHKMNNLAASTPCLGDDLVVLSWYDGARKMAMLSGYDHNGKRLWNYEIGAFQGAHGPNVVPEIHERRIVIAHLHQDGGYVAVLDGKTGKPVWKTDYPGPSIKTTYMTPLVRKRHAADGPKYEVVVASTATGVRGLSYDDGAELWSLPKVFPERCIVSPVDILAGSGAADALLTVGCKKEGGNNVFLAARPPDVNDGKAEVVWHLAKAAPYVPTPVSDGRTLYVLSDRGNVLAVDPRTGEVRWEEKLAGNFFASPLLIGGRLYCLSRDGEVYVAEVGDKFKLVATSDLKPGDEVIWTDATPAVAHDSLYVRLGARLDCYRTR